MFTCIFVALNTQILRHKLSGFGFRRELFESKTRFLRAWTPENHEKSIDSITSDSEIRQLALCTRSRYGRCRPVSNERRLAPVSKGLDRKSLCFDFSQRDPSKRAVYQQVLSQILIGAHLPDVPGPQHRTDRFFPFLRSSNANIQVAKCVENRKN